MAVNSDKIEVSLELVGELIPILEDQIAGFDNQLQSIADIRAGKARMLAELKAKINGSAASVGGNGNRKRLRKGQADKIIYDLLRALPDGEGLTISSVVQATGASYGTVYRTFTDKDRNRGRFEETEQGVWAIAKQ
jgi:hypothetical protein